MEIKEIKENKKQFLSLLLLADEQENMNRMNMDIYIGVASGNEINAKEQIDRIEVLKLPIHYFPSRSKDTLKYCAALKKYLKEKKIDILHVMGNSSTMAIETFIARKYQVPVRIVHCHSTSCKYKICNFLFKPILYYTATNFFACGGDAGKYLYGEKRFTVIPNGNRIEKFLFDAESRTRIKRVMNAEEKIIIGHVGKFVEAKNHKFLIDIFKELCKKTDSYELWIIGDGGNKKEEVCKKITESGVSEKIKLLGFKSDVNKYLSAIDIIVFPSLYEGLPNVVIEYQISGLPCLLSDNITKECRIMDNVKYLSLNAGINKWCDEIEHIEIEDRESQREEIIKKISEAGYDIKKNADMLRKLYINFYERLSIST